MKASEIIKSNPKIYLDLDGVLADLFGHVKDLHGVDHYKKISKIEFEKFLTDVNAEELFAALPAFPITDQIVKLVSDLAGGYTILSSPLEFDEQGSIRGKKIWLKNHIKIPADGYIFESKKYLYAVQADGTPNILIDDYQKNISAWNQHGGIGIKFQSDEDSLDKLRKKLSTALHK